MMRLKQLALFGNHLLNITLPTHYDAIETGITEQALGYIRNCYQPTMMRLKRISSYSNIVCVFELPTHYDAIETQ